MDGGWRTNHELQPCKKQYCQVNEVSLQSNNNRFNLVIFNCVLYLCSDNKTEETNGTMAENTNS